MIAGVVTDDGENSRRYGRAGLDLNPHPLEDLSGTQMRLGGYCGV